MTLSYDALPVHENSKESLGSILSLLDVKWFSFLVLFPASTSFWLSLTSDLAIPVSTNSDSLPPKSETWYCKMVVFESDMKWRSSWLSQFTVPVNAIPNHPFIVFFKMKVNTTFCWLVCWKTETDSVLCFDSFIKVFFCNCPANHNQRQER